MSGVEAIFGVVTGGVGIISLALQLGDCAVRLKKLYHTAKDAPDRLRRLSSEMETMSIALEQIEIHRLQDNHAEYLLGRCIEICQQDIVDIERLVVRLENKIAKYSRGAGRVYAAMKGDEVKELLDGLERSKSSLQFAYLMYLDEGQRRRDQEHVAALRNYQADLHNLHQVLLADDPPLLEHTSREELMAAGRCTVSISSNDTYHVVARTGTQLDRDRWSFVQRTQQRDMSAKRLKVRLPAWLSSRVWELAFVHAQYRCTMHITTYNLISRTHQLSSASTKTTSEAYKSSLPADVHPR